VGDEATHLLRLASPDVARLPYALPTVPVSPALALGVGGAGLLLAAAFTCGWRVGATGAGLSAVLAFVLVLDGQTYSNHLYLAATLVVLLTWAHVARDPAGPLLLLRAQASIVYGFSGLAKLSPDFLSGLALVSVLPPSVRRELIERGIALPVAVGLSAATIVLELWIAASLWRPLVRRHAMVVGVVLHAGMIAGVASGGRPALLGFALLMFALYLLFLAPGVPASTENVIAAPSRTGR
jgi:hypothetical protein